MIITWRIEIEKDLMEQALRTGLEEVLHKWITLALTDNIVPSLYIA